MEKQQTLKERIDNQKAFKSTLNEMKQLTYKENNDKKEGTNYNEGVCSLVWDEIEEIKMNRLSQEKKEAFTGIKEDMKKLDGNENAEESISIVSELRDKLEIIKDELNDPEELLSKIDSIIENMNSGCKLRA